MTEHEHEWRRYILGRDEEGLDKRFYTQAPVEDVPFGWYIGYDCACGEDGYGIPT